MFWSQVVNGLLLPVILVVVLMLVNDRRMMGDYTNGRVYNWFCWISTVLLTSVSIVYIFSLFLFE